MPPRTICGDRRGHETTQIIGERTVAFDDRLEAGAALAECHGGAQCE
jgi:UDP-N-acetylmuramyl tripeptide synthase